MGFKPGLSAGLFHQLIPFFLKRFEYTDWCACGHYPGTVSSGYVFIRTREADRMLPYPVADDPSKHDELCGTSL